MAAKNGGAYQCLVLKRQLQCSSPKAKGDPDSLNTVVILGGVQHRNSIRGEKTEHCPLSDILKDVQFFILTLDILAIYQAFNGLRGVERDFEDRNVEQERTFLTSAMFGTNSRELCWTTSRNSNCSLSSFRAFMRLYGNIVSAYKFVRRHQERTGRRSLATGISGPPQSTSRRVRALPVPPSRKR